MSHEFPSPANEQAPESSEGEFDLPTLSDLIDKDLLASSGLDRSIMSTVRRGLRSFIIYIGAERNHGSVVVAEERVKELDKPDTQIWRVASLGTGILNDSEKREKFIRNLSSNLPTVREEELGEAVKLTTGKDGPLSTDPFNGS